LVIWMAHETPAPAELMESNTEASGKITPEHLGILQPEELSDSIRDNPAQNRYRFATTLVGSVSAHLLLLFWLAGMEPLLISVTPAPSIPGPSVQIRFVTPPPERQSASVEALPAPESGAEPVPTIEPAYVAPPAAEPGPATERLADTPALPDTPPQNEAPSDSPRLLVPRLPDIRNAVRSVSNSSQQSVRTIECDGRQLRNELIDCGEVETRYEFETAQANPTTLYFALPATEPSAPGPRDLTMSQQRVRDNINLVDMLMSSTQTRRAVMGY